MNVQESLTQISSFTSKLLRKKFGRGPETCSATLSNKYLVLYIRGFISPMEEILITQGKPEYVEKARGCVILTVLEEVAGFTQSVLNVEIDQFHDDWNFSTNSGIMILDLSDTNHIAIEDLSVDYLSEFEGEISRISAMLQKVPEQIVTTALSESFILVKRFGILIEIEKALIKKGFSDELLLTKSELEKKYFHLEGHFEKIVGRKIRDIFISWNFKKDESLMCFVLK